MNHNLRKVSRVGLSVLLLLAAMPLLFASTVTSQQYTTTVGETTFTNIPSSVNIFSGMFPMSQLDAQFGCGITAVPFYATQGQSVSGTFSSDNPIGFYIMSFPNFERWVYCDANSLSSMPPTIGGTDSATTYSFNVMIPQSGEWMLVYVIGKGTANVNANVNLSTPIYTVTEQMG